MAKNRSKNRSEKQGSSSCSSKVCLCITCNPIVSNHMLSCPVLRNQCDSQHFYVFDLNPNPDDTIDSFISVAPILRLDCCHVLAPCVLNSTLYLFEGDDVGVGVGDDGFPYPEGKSVYTYDLSSAVPNSILGTNSLGRAPPMHGVKRKTSAIPTPDHRKILVFSMDIVLGSRSYPRADDMIDFELFDSDTNTWQVLPSFPDTREDPNVGEIVAIISHGFLDESTFFVETCNSVRDRFTLDLKSPQNWVEFTGTWTPLNPGRFSLVSGRLCVNYSGVYDICEDLYFNIPPSREARDELPSKRGSRQSMTLLDRGELCDDELRTLCILHSNLDESDRYSGRRGSEEIIRYPHVYIDVHKFDLATCRGRETFIARGTVSSKFVLNSVPYASFTPVYLYPIREAHED